MKNNVFVNRIVRGLFISIPVLAVIYLLKQLYNQLKNLTEKIITQLGLENSWQVFYLVLAVTIALLIIMYLIGWFSQTKPIVNASKKLDEFLLNTSKTYRTIKLKLDNKASFILENKIPIFVKFGSSERPGFLIEEVPENNSGIVFIPKDINNFNGNIYVVPLADIRHSTQEFNNFVYCLDHLGEGLKLS